MPLILEGKILLLQDDIPLFILIAYVLTYHNLTLRSYVILFQKRMTDNGKDGFEECHRMQTIVNGLDSNTRILVASIRDCTTLADLAIEGLDTYTFSPEVA